MKGFRKSTRIASWVLRALAISSALILFSVIGIVALQTATHATATRPTLTVTTPSPAPTTPVPTSTPTLSPTPAITPTPIPPTPMPTPAPKPMPTPTPKVIPTPTTAGNNTPPVATPVATSAALGPAAPPPTQTIKKTPKAQPSPTPPGSPTPDPTGTLAPNSAQGNTSHPSSQPGSDNGTMASIQPLIGPAAGVSTTILLASAGLLALMYWRKRTHGATSPHQLSPVQNPALWMGQQAVSYAQGASYAQPTEISPAQNKTLSPFAMQSIAQYSPLLGTPDTSQVDAPVPSPFSDFRPLLVDYPQILEVHTDKIPVPVTPTILPSLSLTKRMEERQPALQLTSMPLSSLPASPASLEANPMPAPAQIPMSNASTSYQFPQHDSIMETLMQQAQMGIFALPGKDT